MNNYIKINIKELKQILYYLLDCSQDCYYKECKIMIDRFLKRNGELKNEYR